MIYISGLFTLLLLGKCAKKNNIVFLALSGFLLILLMSLHSVSVGSDSENYYNLFSITANGGTTVLYSKSPLFHWIMKYTSLLFGTSTVAYFGTTAILIIIPIWVGIYILEIPCRKAVLLYYLLFFQTSLNGTRTFVSIAFVFLAYALSRKRTVKTFLLSFCLIIASFFIHNIGIIGLPIILISFLNLESRKMRRIVMLTTIALCLGLGSFINLFLNIFDVYSKTLESVADTVGASAIVFQILLIICLLQVFYLIRKRKDSEGAINKEDYDNMSVLLFAEVMIYLAGGGTWYIQRILLYLEVFIICLFPIVDGIQNKYRKIFRATVYVFSMFLFLYGIYRNLNGIMPYQFFWQ